MSINQNNSTEEDLGPCEGVLFASARDEDVEFASITELETNLDMKYYVGIDKEMVIRTEFIAPSCVNSTIALTGMQISLPEFAKFED